MRLLRLAAATCVLALAACGTTGSLKSESPEARRQIADYDQVVVLDLAANDLRPARDDVESAARAQNMAEGRVMFSDAIAEQLTKAGVFTTVSRTPIPGRSLVVTGTIDIWEPGNVATRVLVGFIGKSNFAATIEFRDSWPLPIGASSNVVQTVEFFANEQARNVSSELIKAKGGKVPSK